MAQLHKLELQTQITSPPEKFFDIYKNKTYLMPSISPDKLQSIQVLEGDGKSVGSVRLWTYVMGKVQTKLGPIFYFLSLFFFRRIWLHCHAWDSVNLCTNSTCATYKLTSDRQTENLLSDQRKKHLKVSVSGIPVIAKDKIVAVDEENKSIAFELIGGEVTKYFKSFKATLEADVNKVKWSLEYEKASEDVPHPHSHLEFLVNMSREIDAYLLKP